jgi:2-dehydropantoate 2-reductase
VTPIRSISVVGAGAVGGYYGARLARHGHDVRFLLRGDYETVRARGFDVRSVDGDFTLPPDRFRAYDDPRAMPRSDLVLVTMKSTGNDALPDLVAPLLHETTAVLTLQNGLGNEELLAARFGAGRVLGGMAFVCINRVAPGVIHHSDHGFIRLGEFAGPGRSPRAEAIARLLTEAGIPCDVLDDLRYGRWEKLVWNVPFNGLGALLDAPTDRLIRSDAGLELVRGLMGEIVAAARANGVALPDSVVEEKIAATRSMGAYVSSTHVDRRAGRAMEVEAIFGQPLRAARARGVDAPRLAMLYHALSLLNAPAAP